MVCENCNGKKHVFIKDKGWVPCKCLESIKINRVLEKGNFNKALLKVRTEDFKLNTPNRVSLGKKIKEIVTTNNLSSRLFVYSEDLTKDKVAVILVRSILTRNKNMDQVLFVSLQDIVDSYFNNEGPALSEVKEKDLLVLSLGSEVTNVTHISLMYELLYHRILTDKFTLLVSSLPKDSISSIYKDKIFRLMNKYFDFFNC